MSIDCRVTAALAALTVPLVLAACAPPPPPPAAPTSTVAVPEGAVLENQNTTTAPDGTIVNSSTYRLPPEVISNEPRCNRGDPGYPTCT